MHEVETMKEAESQKSKTVLSNIQEAEKIQEAKVLNNVEQIESVNSVQNTKTLLTQLQSQISKMTPDSGIGTAGSSSQFSYEVDNSSSASHNVHVMGTPTSVREKSVDMSTDKLGHNYEKENCELDDEASFLTSTPHGKYVQVFCNDTDPNICSPITSNTSSSELSNVDLISLPSLTPETEKIGNMEARQLKFLNRAAISSSGARRNLFKFFSSSLLKALEDESIMEERDSDVAEESSKHLKTSKEDEYDKSDDLLMKEKSLSKEENTGECVPMKRIKLENMEPGTKRKPLHSQGRVTKQCRRTIPRLPNSFMIFSSKYRKECTNNMRMATSNISKQFGQLRVRNPNDDDDDEEEEEEEEEKEAYNKLALHIKEVCKQRYRGLGFNPRKLEVKKKLRL